MAERSKKVAVTEQEIRVAMGMSGHSPLADKLVRNLFGPKDPQLDYIDKRLEAQEARLRRIENRVLFLTRNSNNRAKGF